MKITNKTDRFFSKKPKKVPRGNKGIIRDYPIIPETELYKMLESFPDGLTENKITGLAGKYGKNIITKGKKESLFKRIFKSFINPFSMILIFLAVFSSFTEIIWVPSNKKNPVTVIIISIMILVSGFLRLFQESKSGKAAEKLQDLITTTCTVERSGKKKEIPMEELLPGDIVYLSAGDMIPADIRILSAKDLFITQSAITGESSPVEKSGKITYEKNETDKCNLAFMGSSVVSGTGKAIVLRTGNDTLLGKIAEKLVQKVPETSASVYTTSEKSSQETQTKHRVIEFTSTDLAESPLIIRVPYLPSQDEEISGSKGFLQEGKNKITMNKNIINCFIFFIIKLHSYGCFF